MTELKSLDVGYGYSADGGKTFPFRGKGVGLMPSLDEVLIHFPNHELLIQIKSNDPQEGEQLAKYFSTLSPERLNRLTVFGGDKPIAAAKKYLPSLRVMSKGTLIHCLISYSVIGWTGYVPQVCRHTEIHIPEKYAPWLWGWPNVFIKRMTDVDTRVVLVVGVISAGFDSPEDVKRLPPNYTGGIWTSCIDKIAPIFKQNE